MYYIEIRLSLFVGLLLFAFLFGAVLAWHRYHPHYARFKWLRDQHWTDDTLVVTSVSNIKAGADCPSLGRLDERVDHLMLLEYEGYSNEDTTYGR